MNPDNEKELQEITIIDKEYEENIFWILVHIMDEKKWRVLFKDGTPGIYVVMRKLEEKMKENIPEIYNHIIDIGVSTILKTTYKVRNNWIEFLLASNIWIAHLSDSLDSKCSPS